jgi:sugar phosphate isomerase/epimerase
MDSLLPQSIEFAAEAGANYLIAFSFHRGGAPDTEPPAAVVDAIARAAEMAAAAELDLLVETEEGHFANSGARTAELVERIGNPALGVNWDPANALVEGDTPFPDGYAAVRKHVRNVHFKDLEIFPDGRWRIVEQGGVDWAGQIAALADDGYTGTIAVEPHLSPGVASTRRALQRLQALIEEHPPKVSTG